MAQLVVRVTDEVAEALDALIESGLVESRSAAVRQAIDELLDRHRRRQTAAEIIAGYEAVPQLDDQLAWSDAATLAMISEEVW